MPAVTAPRAPRAMAQQAGTDSMGQILHNIAKKLYPRLALFDIIAGFKDDYQRRIPSSDELCEDRRGFLDSFAYLCDIEKGGATVTAVGLQELQLSNCLWLAANEGIREDVKVYAEGILWRLQKVDLGNEKAVEDEIFQLAVKKCSPRIAFYNDQMRKYARNCRMQLRFETRDDMVKSLRSQLKNLSEPSQSMTPAGLVDACYAARGVVVDQIKRRSKNTRDDFSELAHYIGRMGATRSSAKTLVRAMMKVPALRQISGIRTVEAPEPQEVRIDQENMTPYEIVWRICKDSTSQNPMQIRDALHATVDLDIPLNNKIRTGLASRKSIITRVHAELQIADRFSRDQHMKFVGNDRYIGSSKPACYFCHSWLSNHKHRYVLPATHHKIIVGCRGPDSKINESGATILREMYDKVCRRLDQDILAFLLNSQQQNVHLRHHYMSTEGSSRAPSQIATRPLIEPAEEDVA